LLKLFSGKFYSFSHKIEVVTGKDKINKKQIT
jgi:hypothetical protein